MNKGAEVMFSTTEQSQFDRDLSTADRVLLRLAYEYKCEFLRDAGRGWAGRTLRRRVGLRTFVLRLALNPNFLEDGNVFYQVIERWSFEFGELLTRVLRARLGERLDRNEVNDENRLREVFSEVLANNLRRRQPLS
jgi:hypothetical protein